MALVYSIGELYSHCKFTSKLCVVADANPVADFFVDDPDGLPKFHSLSNSESAGVESNVTSTATCGTAVDTGDAELARTFSAINGMIRDDVVKSINAVYIFDLKGCILCE